jgi:hypothetical protein
MSPLERAARVLCDLTGRDPDEVCIGEGKAVGQTWLGWEAFVSDARAVVAAIREPSEGMVRAVDEPADGYGEHIWQMMIDALLDERERLRP